MNSMKRQKDMTWEDQCPRSEGVRYATGEEQRAITNSSRKNELTGPKQKQHTVVDVSSGKRKSCKSYKKPCIGTWNVKSMNQGKLDVERRWKNLPGDGKIEH